MSIFYICWCGNTQDDHNFKHEYDPCIEVHKTDGNAFSFSALSFPVKKEERCSVRYCTATKWVHRKPSNRVSEIINPVTIIDHEFDPVPYMYREIKFSVPEGTHCIHKNSKGELCGIPISTHSRLLPDHHFTIKVLIKDIDEKDKVKITYRKDEDLKITRI